MPGPKKRPKKSVSIVGAGRLGSALAVALRKAGYGIDFLIARRRTSARRALRLLDGEAEALAENQLKQMPPSDLIIISTPDDAIEMVARKLAGLPGDKERHRIFLHTSGALSSAVLAPLADRGFAVGSLHPLSAVSDPQKGTQPLQGAFWSVEGDRRAGNAARRIVADLGGESFSIAADKKPLYHAAAVMVSGHTVALFDMAIEMLERSGLSAQRARQVLLPLVESNARNLATVDVVKALTGSFARADLATIQRHLRAISSSKFKDALEVYRLLGKRSLKLANRTNADKEALKKIEKLLK